MTRTQRFQWCIAAGSLVLLFLRVGAGFAAQTTIHGRVTYEVKDGVYVSAGTDNGLAAGLTGTVQFEDGRTARFEVLHAAKQSSFLRLLDHPQGERLLDRSVDLTFEPPGAEPTTGPQDGEAQADAPPTAASPSPETVGDKEFVPLLAPLPKTPEAPALRNVTHGRVEVRELTQIDAPEDLGYSMMRLRSSGNIDRIEGSPWSFSWSGDLRYRSGDAFENHAEYEQIGPRFHRLMFQRPIEDGGFLRFGRFVPIELPGIGYVDGIQGETRGGQGLRLGVVTGLKPDRVDLDASVNEPFVAGYATVEAGRRGASYYSGTVGLLSTYYEGAVDRLALLLDQRVGLGSGFTLYSTAEVDLDAGAAETRDGVSLTRLDVFAEAKLSSSIRLRAGADHWERPDNEAERDLLTIDDERFFDAGYWRYWVGSSQKLPWDLQLYEEVSLIDSDNTDDTARWQVRLTRTGLFDMRNASASLTVYTLASHDSGGYGCRASAYFPLFDNKITVQPAAGFRTLEVESQTEDLTVSYLSLYLDGRLSKTWTLFAGLNCNSGDRADSTLLELGLRYSW